MTCDIMNLIHERDKLLYSFKKSRCQEQYKQFCAVRNKVNREIKNAKTSYFSNKIEEHQNDSKRLWKQLKSLGNSNKQADHSNVVLNIDGELCYDAKTIANHFKSCFLPRWRSHK